MKSTRLRPLFGIRPGIYISAAALVLLLLVFFLLLLLPGIRNHGSLVTVTTDAPGAAVFVDGVFKGSTPLEVFIHSGERNIRIEKPYFQKMEYSETVKGRLFFSLLFPRKSEVSYTLAIEDIEGYLSWRLQDLYQWSLVTNYTQTYQYPGILIRTAADAAAVPEIMESPAFSEFLSFLPYLNSSRRINEDISSALESMGISPSMPEAVSLPGSAWFFDVMNLYQHDLEFIGIESDDIDTFYISSGLISRDLFSTFIEEVPFWHRDNLNELLTLNKADSTYLHSQGTFTDRVINVSYHAAEAFALWLDELYPGYSISIPTALQWEAAALAAGEDQVSGLWQWTSSYYYPGIGGEYSKLPDLLTFEPHYHLKGGNSQTGSDNEAALTPSVCSPVAGIRLILVKE